MYFTDYPAEYNTSSVIAWDIPSGSKELLIAAVVRGKEPFKGDIALPGGFKEAGETLEAAAARELKEETGAIVAPSKMQLVYVQSDPNRDPRTEKTKIPVIDHVYSVWMPAHFLRTMKAGDDATQIHIIRYENTVTQEELNKRWAFDHGDSIWRFMQTIHWLPQVRNEVV